MHIFEYDKLWGPSQRVVTLFNLLLSSTTTEGLLGLLNLRSQSLSSSLLQSLSLSSLQSLSLYLLQYLSVFNDLLLSSTTTAGLLCRLSLLSQSLSLSLLHSLSVFNNLTCCYHRPQQPAYFASWTCGHPASAARAGRTRRAQSRGCQGTATIVCKYHVYCLCN